jgi:CubicO group peptidase (beta-lactamase class C family)
MAGSGIDRAIERAVELGEQGLQVAAYVGEELVVDTWTGLADVERGIPVDGNTLFPIWGTTKGVSVTALHVQAERGLIDIDAPVCSYWPEYGVHGKDRVRVSDILMHRSGAPQMPAGVTPELAGDWDWVVNGLAALEPVHEPGVRSIFHSMSMGWLVGELVRRTDPLGRPFAQFLRDEIFTPLGIEDLWLGLPPDRADRLATLVNPQADVQPRENQPFWEATTPKAIGPGPLYTTKVMREVCHPSAGALSNARSLARLFAMLANGGSLDGVRLLSPDRVMAQTALRPRPYEIDECTGHAPLLGVGGYWMGGDYPLVPPEVGPGPHILSHPGWGGTSAFADLDTKLAVAIVHNHEFASSARLPIEEHPFTMLGSEIRKLLR